VLGLHLHLHAKRAPPTSINDRRRPPNPPVRPSRGIYERNSSSEPRFQPCSCFLEIIEARRGPRVEIVFPRLLAPFSETFETMLVNLCIDMLADTCRRRVVHMENGEASKACLAERSNSRISFVARCLLPCELIFFHGEKYQSRGKFPISRESRINLLPRARLSDLCEIRMS